MINHGFGVSFARVTEPIDQLLSWRNDPRISHWCRQHDLISPNEHEAWFKAQENCPHTKMFEVWLLDDLVGVCGLTSIDYIHNRAEFSLYIDPERHGEGLGKKALKTLLKHGFDNYGLNRIWGESFHGNPAIKMFQDLGFEKEGTRRDFYFKGGKFIDAHLYSISHITFQEKWGSID